MAYLPLPFEVNFIHLDEKNIPERGGLFNAHFPQQTCSSQRTIFRVVSDMRGTSEAVVSLRHVGCSGIKYTNILREEIITALDDSGSGVAAFPRDTLPMVIQRALEVGISKPDILRNCALLYPILCSFELLFWIRRADIRGVFYEVASKDLCIFIGESERTPKQPANCRSISVTGGR